LKAKNTEKNNAPFQLESVGFGRRPFCCIFAQGRNSGDLVEKPLLIADVIGDEIIVRTLGFFAAYTKPSNAPQLILRRRTETDNHELLAQAWHAANHKARELGWIV
jgi:hypothetical protein